MPITTSREDRKRPDPFDPRIGTGREPEADDPEDEAPDVDDVETDGKELGG
jgi:hypothetical protein